MEVEGIRFSSMFREYQRNGSEMNLTRSERESRVQFVLTAFDLGLSPGMLTMPYVSSTAYTRSLLLGTYKFTAVLYPRSFQDNPIIGPLSAEPGTSLSCL